MSELPAEEANNLTTLLIQKIGKESKIVKIFLLHLLCPPGSYLWVPYLLQNLAQCWKYFSFPLPPPPGCSPLGYPLPALSLLSLLWFCMHALFMSRALLCFWVAWCLVSGYASPWLPDDILCQNCISKNWPLKIKEKGFIVGFEDKGTPSVVVLWINIIIFLISSINRLGVLFIKLFSGHHDAQKPNSTKSSLIFLGLIFVNCQHLEPGQFYSVAFFRSGDIYFISLFHLQEETESFIVQCMQCILLPKFKFHTVFYTLGGGYLHVWAL